MHQEMKLQLMADSGILLYCY